MATTTINISILILHLGLLIISTFLNYSPRAVNTSWCKAYAYTYYFSVYISITLLAAATIDRWLSTSRTVRLRSFSSIRNTRIIIGSIILFYSLLLIPHPIYSKVYFEPTRNATKCDRLQPVYRIYVNYILVLLVHGISILIMVIFGFLTYRHLAAGSHGQIHGRRTIKHRINIQMTWTLFIQIFIYIICIIPNWIITILYPTLTANIIQRSAERIAIEMLFNNLSTLSYYASFGDTFYILLIVSPTFRRNIKVLFRFQHDINRVTPRLPTIQE